jgi:hypothetical protein
VNGFLTTPPSLRATIAFVICGLPAKAGSHGGPHWELGVGIFQWGQDRCAGPTRRVDDAAGGFLPAGHGPDNRSHHVLGNSQIADSPWIEIVASACTPRRRKTGSRRITGPDPRDTASDPTRIDLESS